MGLSRESLPRTSRVLKSSDFLDVKTRGIRSRSGKVTVARRPGPTPRLGVIATRRSGNSVERNRLKRVAREFFRKKKDALAPGDYVVVFAPGAGLLENEELRLMIRNAFAGLVKSKRSG